MQSPMPARAPLPDPTPPAAFMAIAIVLAACLAPGALAGPTDGPLPPLALTADTTSGDVVLSWQAPAGNVDGYRVYRADDAEAVALHGLDAFAPIGETTALSFVDIVGTGANTESGDGEEGRFIYYVTALRGGDESLPSNLVGVQYPRCWDLFPPDSIADCFIP